MQTYAQTQAAKIDTIVHEEEYLRGYLYFDKCQEEYETLRTADFTRLADANIFIVEADDINLLQVFDDGYSYTTKAGVDDVSPELVDAAKSRLYTLPLIGCDYGESKYWIDLLDYISIDDAFEMPELDGIAYVIQYYNAEKAMIVTSIMTMEYPITISHTELLCGDNIESLQTMLYTAIGRCYGYDLEFVIKRYENTDD